MGAIHAKSSSGGGIAGISLPSTVYPAAALIDRVDRANGHRLMLLRTGRTAFGAAATLATPDNRPLEGSSTKFARKSAVGAFGNATLLACQTHQLDCHSPLYRQAWRGQWGQATPGLC